MFDRQELNETLDRLGLAPQRDLFPELSDLYGEAGRHYHNQRHISECLKALARFAHLAERPDEVALAIWFHDAVYDTKRSDNEERSAVLAEQFLTEAGASGDCVTRVGAMIRATQSHVAEGVDATLMLDIDLGILGQGDEVFEAYDRAIRREYDWVDDSQYRQARAAVLESFLARPRIYGTQEFHDAYETQARANLARKIKALAGPGDDNDTG